jgi:hypothetical protein
VGPNFKRPAAPDVNGYTPAPLSTTEGVTNVLGGEPQRFLSGTNLPGEWWSVERESVERGKCYEGHTLYAPTLHAPDAGPRA